MKTLTCVRNGQLVGKLASTCAALAVCAVFCQTLRAESGGNAALLDYEGKQLAGNLSWLKSAMDVRDSGGMRLTIRGPLQEIAHGELENLVRKFNPRRAYAIMADPYTGDILALAVVEGSRKDNKKDGEATPSDFVFEPGSTMKPVPVAAAIDLGAIGPDSRFDCERGQWIFAGKTLWDAAPHGKLSVSEIVAKSSNIGTAKIALELGAEKLHAAFRSFGFGRKTGLPFSQEQTGMLRDPKSWDKLSAARFPIGQGISCTPFQLVRAYCALANGGTLPSLRLVCGAEDPKTGKTAAAPSGRGEKIFLKDGTCGTMASMLKLACREGGTGANAAVQGYEVAGVPGTSQKWVDGRYSDTAFIASFIGFVPADKPAFVLLVIADEPQVSPYGGVVAAPAFKDIAGKSLKALDDATANGKGD